MFGDCRVLAPGVFPFGVGEHAERVTGHNRRMRPADAGIVW